MGLEKLKIIETE